MAKRFTLIITMRRIFTICGALRDLVPFVQFKKHEKYPWRSADFSKDATCNFTKINTSPWVFFTFFKLYKWYQIAECITICQSTLVLELRDLL